MSGSFRLLYAFGVASTFLRLLRSFGISVKFSASGQIMPSALTFPSCPGELKLDPGHYFCINEIFIMQSIMKY